MSTTSPKPDQSRERSVAEVFDEIGARYDEGFADNQGQIDAAQELIRQLAPGSRVLDIGSGTGRPTAEQLAAAGMRVVGIDVSGVMVELARGRVPTATFIQRDVLDLRGDAAADLGMFEALTAYFSLLGPAEHTVAALTSARGVLRPGGLLSLGAVQYPDSTPVSFFGHTYTPTPSTPDTLAEAVQTAGFTIRTVTSARHEPATPEVAARTHIFILAQRAES